MIWVLQFMVVFLKLWPQQLSNQAIDLQVSYCSLRKCLLMDSCVQQLPLRVHHPHNPLLAPTTPPRNAAPGPTLHRSPIWCYLSRLLPIACSSLHPLRSPVSIVFPGDEHSICSVSWNWIRQRVFFFWWKSEIFIGYMKIIYKEELDAEWDWELVRLAIIRW